MFDSRIYRAALLPAVLAFGLMMFSLEPIPKPLERPVVTPEFDGTQAARMARQIVARAPDRNPGSEGDRTVAAIVADEFKGVEGGEVATQDFDSTFRGGGVSLQNVVLTIPGNSPKALLVLASRDSADGLGAASSASATAELMSLARALGSQRHEQTIILASTDGGSDGAQGAQELIDSLPRSEEIGSALVISQPGVDTPKAPFVISSGTGPESPSIQLVETARAIAADAYDQRDQADGPWVGLSRLAVPIGLGEQAVLRGAGVEAVALSADGERLIAPSADDSISSEALGQSGTAALELILTLDGTSEPIAEGPGDYVRLGDNLIPGWTIALLAITLLIAPLLTAADTWLREQRADWRTRKSIPWALERALLPLASLFAAYGLGLVGLLPDPQFPYDPAGFPPGAKGPIAFVVLAAVFALAGLLIRPMRTPLDSEPHTLAAAAGLMSGIALLGIWALNPFLALLLAPAAHVWLLVARTSGAPRAATVAVVGLVSLGGAFAAFATVASVLDLGLAAPWHGLLLIVDGQIGFGTCLLCCLLLGGLIACVSATAAERRALPSELGTLRGAGSHVGPGALGSIPAADARHR